MKVFFCLSGSYIQPWPHKLIKKDSKPILELNCHPSKVLHNWNHDSSYGSRHNIFFVSRTTSWSLVGVEAEGFKLRRNAELVPEFDSFQRRASAYKLWLQTN